MRKLLLILVLIFTVVIGGCVVGNAGKEPLSGKDNKIDGLKSGTSKDSTPKNSVPDKTTPDRKSAELADEDDSTNEIVKDDQLVTIAESYFDSGLNKKIIGGVFWSPDKSRFAYIADEPGDILRVYLVTSSQNNQKVKIKEFPYDRNFGSPFVSLGWSTDGSNIYYLYSSNVGPDFRPSFKMGKVDLLTGKEKAYRMKDISIIPSTVNWAPNAGLVSFWGDGGIQKVELGSGKMKRMVRLNSSNNSFTVVADTKGTKLAYTRVFGYRDVSQQKVFVLDILTGKEVQVSPEGEYSWNPQWLKQDDKLGMLTVPYPGKVIGISPGLAGGMPDCDSITVVKASGEIVRKMQFKGESIISFSPLVGPTDLIEVYTGRKVKMTEEGGISFALDTHRIMDTNKGTMIWEKKFPKVQSGENNEVEWVDENLWVNMVYTPNSETKTLLLKDINDQELAKVDDVIGRTFPIEQGLVFLRKIKSGQTIWFLSKSGVLSQLSKETTAEQIIGVTDGKIIYLDKPSDGKTKNYVYLSIKLNEQQGEK